MMMGLNKFSIINNNKQIIRYTLIIYNLAVESSNTLQVKTVTSDVGHRTWSAYGVTSIFFIVITGNRRILFQVNNRSNPINDNMSDYKLNSYAGHNIIINII